PPTYRAIRYPCEILEASISMEAFPIRTAPGASGVRTFGALSQPPAALSSLSEAVFSSSVRDWAEACPPQPPAKRRRIRKQEIQKIFRDFFIYSPPLCKSYLVKSILPFSAAK